MWHGLHVAPQPSTISTTKLSRHDKMRLNPSIRSISLRHIQRAFFLTDRHHAPSSTSSSNCVDTWWYRHKCLIQQIYLFLLFLVLYCYAPLMLSVETLINYPKNKNKNTWESNISHNNIWVEGWFQWSNPYWLVDIYDGTDSMKSIY